MAIRRTRTREEPVAQGTRVNRALGNRMQRQREESKKATHLIVRYKGPTSPLAHAIEGAGAELQGIRPGKYLHVSDLLSKCIRKRALHDLQGTVPPPRRLTLSDLLTFAQGDAIHDLLKGRARKGAGNQVWGNWSCKCKSLYHEEPCTYGEIDQEEECPHCLTKVDTYHEVPMRDEEYWIVGNPDLILYLENLDAFFITELKSIAPDQFKELVRPKPEHVLQVVFYWFLMQRLGYRLVDKVSIFYATKGWLFGGTKPYKEFVIDPEKELKRLDPMLADAAANKRYVEEGVLPPRIFCSSANSKDAKACEVAEPCFHA